jgi:hypothetical protein
VIYFFHADVTFQHIFSQLFKANLENTSYFLDVAFSASASIVAKRVPLAFGSEQLQVIKNICLEVSL